MTAVDFEAFVERLAQVAGEAVMPFFRTMIGVEDKGGLGRFDPVTAADRAGESAMRQLIKSTFPGHGIVGEEFGNENEDAEYVWVLDPIDGTRGFISGLPTWGTLIGLLRHGAPVYGMMSQPFTKERFLGGSGTARTRGPLGERRLRTRSCAGLAEATLSSTSPRLFAGDDLKAFEAVEAVARHTRYGGDCYAYCMLAAGQIDLVIEVGLKPYDIVALIPVIEGAGGIITGWDGGAAAGGGRVVAAGDKRVHAAVMEVLNAPAG
ncbi:histidinol-phosphatase [Terrihabitans sp. B22-R8]|uniref:histidinol-phosphatase n=1 Tax=Terrihabitans sp. B22-R8 TaxID=3425128 RepID=UPI00403C3EAB